MAQALSSQPAVRLRQGRAAGAGFAAGAAALALYLLTVPDGLGDATVAARADVAGVASAFERPAVVPAAAAPPPRKAPAPAARGLIAAFESAPDLRVFVDAALRLPAEGGVFYALRALAECRRWSAAPGEPESDIVVQRSHRELGQRRAWAEVANRRCASFAPDELADAEVERLLALGEQQGDPLVLAYRGWLDAVVDGEIEAIAAALARALHRADPALLDWVAQAGADYIGSGAAVDPPLDEAALRRRRDAWALLPCELGADCARPDLGAASRCLGAGLCLDGQREAVVLHGAWRSDAERAALEAEVAALARAVQARDARAMLGLAAAER